MGFGEGSVIRYKRSGHIVWNWLGWVCVKEPMCPKDKTSGLKFDILPLCTIRSSHREHLVNFQYWQKLIFRRDCGRVQTVSWNTLKQVWATFVASKIRNLLKEMHRISLECLHKYVCKDNTLSKVISLTSIARADKNVVFFPLQWGQRSNLPWDLRCKKNLWWAVEWRAAVK